MRFFEGAPSHGTNGSRGTWSWFVAMTENFLSLQKTGIFDRMSFFFIFYKSNFGSNDELSKENGSVDNTACENGQNM